MSMGKEDARVHGGTKGGQLDVLAIMLFLSLIKLFP